MKIAHFIIFSVLILSIFGCVNNEDTTGSAIRTTRYILPVQPPDWIDDPIPVTSGDLIISRIELGPRAINQPVNYSIFVKNVATVNYFGQVFGTITIATPTNNTNNSTPQTAFTLLPNQENVLMAGTFTPTESGQYTITATVTATNEANTQNNSANMQFTITPPPQINYDSLLNNPRITTAIQSNSYSYFTLGEYRPLLVQKLNELETGNTQSWNNFRKPGPYTQVSPYTNQELKEVFLQKIAMSLYIEAHQLVPWSILNFSDADLQLLLGDKFRQQDQYGQNWLIFNNNPLKPFEYAQQLRALYPNHQINTQKDLLDLVVIKMRDDRWRHHASGDGNYEQLCSFAGGVLDFECLKEVKIGGSGITPLFIYSILQTQNIPAKQVNFFGHGGLTYPTLNIAMDGDIIYNGISAGIRKRPNFVHVDVSYLPLNTFNEWTTTLPVCKGSSNFHRKLRLDYLSYYNDPSWNTDHITAYCFNFPEAGMGYPNNGDYLFSRLSSSTPNNCQSQNPALNNYFPPSITPEEITQWRNALAATIVCP